MPVHHEVRGDVHVLTLDRQEALNALDAALIQDLAHNLQHVTRARARCAVITGRGKAFVAGADIKSMSGMTPQEAHAYSRAGHRLVNQLLDAPFPTIAAINGYALGGGLELALACDVRVASELATFGLPEVTLGVIPGFGGTQLLTRLIGLGPALDLLVTGRRINALEARDLGVITHVVQPDKLLDRSLELAAGIAANAPKAVAAVRRAARNGFGGGLEAGLALEASAFSGCFATEDQREGMRAFLEKRRPVYRGN